MQKKTFFLLLIISLTHNFFLAQNLTRIPDSLKKFDYDTYRERIFNNPHNTYENNILYANCYLLKAKQENNNRELVYGYDLFAEIFNDFNKSIKYSDTAIKLANEKYPKAVPYLYSTRGYLFYNKKRLKESLNCFLIAIKDSAYLSKNLHNNIYYSIGLIKKTQGNYKEAISIYQKCMKNAFDNKDNNYLRYLLGLAELYNRINKITVSKNLTEKGISECNNYDFGSFYLPYFISNRGKNNFKIKKNKEAIIDLKNTLKDFEKNNDFSNYSENCFYIGEAYTELNQIEKAIPYYKKIDSIYSLKNDISLLTIKAYEKIIGYYKKRKNYNEVIFYSDQFIKADKLLDENLKYISNILIKEYDIQEAISSKQKLISNLKNEKFSLKNIILFLLLGILFLFGLLYLNNRKRIKQLQKQKYLFDSYKKEREQKILAEKEHKDKLVTKKTSIDNIDEGVVSNILSCLQKFELELKFLEKEYTVEMLSSEFKTNSNYLSKVINTIKDTTFTQYINKLRIEYILNKLENDKKILNYTIQALSEICGYNSVQTFTRAFKSYTKMNPSDFIKELKNNSKE